MNKRRGFGIWPLVLAVILLAVLLYDTMLLNRAGDYTYPQFLQDIQERADAIEEVIIVPNVEVPTGKVEVLWNDDSQSECYVTDVNEVQSLLKQTSVDRWFVTDAQRDSWLEKNGLLLGFGIIALVLFFSFISSQQGGSNSKMMNFGKSRAKMSDESAKETTFKKVAGLEEEKEELQEVVDFLKNPRRYTELGARIPKGVILVGPPGTGKTSIARSLAKALKKPYVRISLGGVRDEAEIRGHRKTYVGAMPGRIANGIRQAGVKNPLMLLDEIDKVSTDYKGDTFSALLEVLDSEQNYKFRDHYLEVPLDLSEVLFIATANSLQTIPRPLLDRMEVIEVTSYTENEKLHIATEHLIPKQLEKNGLKKEQLKISKNAVWKIASNYTKEAGVRQLEREIGNICRKAAKEILTTGKKSVTITEKNLFKYLGKEKFTYQMANAADEIGIVRGLAWTSVGGDTLQIEVNVMPGKGEIMLTGQLGDVMKESARTGISYIRSVSRDYQIADDFFEKHDIHVHIPEGAVPKDGPSAGITMATAMLSAITEQKVRADIAMTGEVTLRGRVLPIGGLKEKLLAAKNAGIKTVLVPKKNLADVEELSQEITKGLEILPVEHMEEVLKAAFVSEDQDKISGGE